MTSNKEFWDRLLADEDWWSQFRDPPMLDDFQEIVSPALEPKKPAFNPYKDNHSDGQQVRLRYEYYGKTNYRDASWNRDNQSIFLMFDRMGYNKTWYENKKDNILYSPAKASIHINKDDLPCYTLFPSDKDAMDDMRSGSYRKGDTTPIPYWKQAPIFLRVPIQSGKPIWYRPYSEVVAEGCTSGMEHPKLELITTPLPALHALNLSQICQGIKDIAKSERVKLPKQPKQPKDTNRGKFRKGKSAAELFGLEKNMP